MIGSQMRGYGLFRTFLLIGMIWGLSCTNSWAERIFFAGYDGGFYIRSEEEGGMELRLGGAFQVDARKFMESERSEDGFDIRRARLLFKGDITRYFSFGLEYEFEGNETKHLVEAYGQASFLPPHHIRFGQFKEPFSLEWQTRDKGLFFAERSMGYHLTPKRDIGVAVHGSFFHDRLLYNAGIFNGDGVDTSSSTRDRDDPEFCGRLVAAPFKDFDFPFLDSFQAGFSASIARIDLSNVDLEVKSTGMYASGVDLYTLSHDTKFGVLKGVDQRRRFGFDLMWTHGPLALMGEYFHLSYTDLTTSSHGPMDADFSSYYMAAAWCITGEELIISNGAMKPLYPDRFFNPSEKTWGAFVLGLRYDHFSGDENWIVEDRYVSTSEADAYTVALNWVLFPMQRFILDFTQTEFSDPIKVRVNSEDGSVDFIERESLVTLRFSIDF